MKLRNIFLSLILLVTAPAYADLEPLNVAVDSFSPAFVMRGGKNQLYGFDIEMMVSICKLINRKCVFQPMPFSQLVTSVEQQNSDVAVGSIAINLDRLRHVNISNPYLPSQGRFVSRANPDGKNFTFSALNGKIIGYENGTIFPEVITEMNVINPTLKGYNSAESLIAALQNDEINYAVADNPGVVFWVNQTSGHFMALGTPFNYGSGLGILVNKNDTALLNSINSALAIYLNSPEFKLNYNTYINY